MINDTIRICKIYDPFNDEYYYELRSVTYDGSIIISISEEPIELIGSSVADIADSINSILDAFNNDVLEYEEYQKLWI